MNLSVYSAYGMLEIIKVCSSAIIWGFAGAMGPVWGSSENGLATRQRNHEDEINPRRWYNREGLSAH